MESLNSQPMTLNPVSRVTGPSSVLPQAGKSRGCCSPDYSPHPPIRSTDTVTFITRVLDPT